MADNSKIEWTDATWNPITGCSVVSPGCTNCYAMKLAGTRLRHHPSRKGLTRTSKAGPVWNGKVRLNEAWLRQPSQWRRPRMIFVCAHGDLFAESVPIDWIDRVFAEMRGASHHTFQVLTKRAARMRDYITGLPERRKDFDCDSALDDCDWPLPNVWLGVSAEDQKRADERIPELLATPAAIRFLSYEPALGPLDLDRFYYVGPEGGWEHHGAKRQMLHWVIAGGESGPGARPAHPEWFRSVRDQCAAAGVAYHFKQWGAWAPYYGTTHISDEVFIKTESVQVTNNDGIFIPMVRVGKKKAGRLLDGVEHNGFPAC